MVNPSTSWYHARLLPRSFTVSETESMLAWKDSDSACLVAPSGIGELVLMDPPVVMRLIVIYCVLFCLLVNSYYFLSLSKMMTISLLGAPNTGVATPLNSQPSEAYEFIAASSFSRSNVPEKNRSFCVITLYSFIQFSYD